MTENVTECDFQRKVVVNENVIGTPSFYENDDDSMGLGMLFTPNIAKGISISSNKLSAPAFVPPPDSASDPLQNLHDLDVTTTSTSPHSRMEVDEHALMDDILENSSHNISQKMKVT